MERRNSDTQKHQEWLVLVVGILITKLSGEVPKKSWFTFRTFWIVTS